MSLPDTTRIPSLLNEYRKLNMEMNKIISDGGSEDTDAYKRIDEQRKVLITKLRATGYDTGKLVPRRGRLRRYVGPVASAIKARTDLLIEEAAIKDVKDTTLPAPKAGIRYRFNPVSKEWVEEDDGIDLDTSLPDIPNAPGLKIKRGQFPPLKNPQKNDITGVYIVWNNKLLIHLRSVGEYTKNTISIPTGSLEEGEGWVDGAMRELSEQTQIRLPETATLEYLVSYSPIIKQKEFTLRNRVYFTILLQTKPIVLGADTAHINNVDKTFNFFSQGITGESAGSNTGHYWADINKLIEWLDKNESYKFITVYKNLLTLRTKLGLSPLSPAPSAPPATPTPSGPSPSAPPATPTTPTTPEARTPEEPTKPIDIAVAVSALGPSQTQDGKREEIKLAGRVYYIDYDSAARDRRKAIFEQGADLQLTDQENDLLTSVGIQNETRKNLLPYLYDFFESLPNCQTSVKMMTSRECEVAYYVMWSVLMKARQDVQRNIDAAHKDGNMPDSEMFQTEARIAAMSKVPTTAGVDLSGIAKSEDLKECCDKTHEQQEELQTIINRIEEKLNSVKTGVDKFNTKSATKKRGGNPKALFIQETS